MVDDITRIAASLGVEANEHPLLRPDSRAQPAARQDVLEALTTLSERLRGVEADTE